MQRAITLALALLGATIVTSGAFPAALDSGWGGDQRLTLSSATFAAGAYADTFVPAPSTAPAPTCNLPADAAIKITKTAT